MAATDERLLLHEELLLLALRDRKGTIHHRAAMHPYALAGGMLAELLLAGRIAIEEGRKRLVDVVRAAPLGEPLLDECLAALVRAPRRRRLRSWVSRFARLRRLRERVALRLCARGILRESEERILWLFRRKVYPQRDPRCEQRLVERLRRAIFTETRQVDARTVILAGLAHSAGMLAIPFERKALRGRKKRLDALFEADILEPGAREIVRAARAAVEEAHAAVAAAAAAATAGG